MPSTNGCSTFRSRGPPAPPTSRPGPARSPPPAELPRAMRLTFVGHSTVLIELDGMRILTDPLLRERFVHVRRRVPPVDPALVADVDVVVVSHVHHDHLDRPSLRKVARNATVLVPRGARRLV